MRESFWNIFREAMVVNNRSVPWGRAIGAAFAMATPILVGLLINQFHLGIIAGLGGFAYLYVFKTPYALQSKKMLFVGASLVLSALLGSLAAPYPIAISIIMGLIAAFMIFIFNALKFIGPSALFFVLVFAISADMEHVNFLDALARAGLVSLGAILSWLIAMCGFLISPHQPEMQSLYKSYTQLINLSKSVGTDDFQKQKYLTMAVLKETEETLSAGQLPWSPSETYTRLLHLAYESNEYLLYLGNHYANSSKSLPPEVIKVLEEITHSIKCKLKTPTVYTEIVLEDLSLQKRLQNMQKALKNPINSLKPLTINYNYKVIDILLNAFDPNSLVLVTAFRFGIITTVSALIGYAFDFTRSYWISLSCVAVMSGASMVATYYRAIQRSIGTIIGVIIASIILYFDPSNYALVLFIFFFTLLTELYIVKNYGLAIIFITPNAVLLATTLTPEHFSFLHFSGIRIMDVLIGSAIGLIGVIITSKGSASNRIPKIVMRTLRDQSQMLLLLFSPPKASSELQIQARLTKMKTNLSNLTALYTAAIGEIPKNKPLIEYYWPLIHSIEKLAFLLENAAVNPNRPQLTDEELSKILYLFETMANCARFDEPNKFIEIPKIPGFYSLEREINTLQTIFSVNSPHK